MKAKDATATLDVVLWACVKIACSIRKFPDDPVYFPDTGDKFPVPALREFGA